MGLGDLEIALMRNYHCATLQGKIIESMGLGAQQILQNYHRSTLRQKNIESVGLGAQLQH